ncbi:MAG TPA: hypothetical protein VK763_03505 [Terriglobales bacterium]|nr:hypothetical protein [Terriglobales bacterium]
MTVELVLTACVSTLYVAVPTAWGLADLRENSDVRFGCLGATVPAASTVLAAIRSQRQRTQRMATV